MGVTGCPIQWVYEGPMSFELFISRRYLKTKPNQAIIALITLLSVVGVTIGVTALIVVIAVMAGFESDLKSRIMGIEPHLLIEGQKGPMDQYAQLIHKIRTHSSVTAAWPVVDLQVILKSETGVTGAAIKGIDPVAASKGLSLGGLLSLQKGTSTSGDVSLHSAPLPPVVLGRDLARTLGLLKGDTLFVVSPRGTLAPVGYIPSMKRFLVAGFFETGMYEYDGSLAFLNLEDAQALARIGTSVHGIEIRVADIFDTDLIGRSLVSSIGKGYRFKDWMQMNKNLFAALKLEKSAMFITLSLIILIATFSIASSLVMMVMEKTKDIAILKTMGATKQSIRKMYVLQGMIIGAVGTIAGVAIGTTLCVLQDSYHLIRLPGDVYYITALPVDLKIVDVTLVALSALGICFLATLFPAFQAARLNPVEAIRHG
jgi:lipoprotein-releasing system permease protein